MTPLTSFTTTKPGPFTQGTNANLGNIKLTAEQLKDLIERVKEIALKSGKTFSEVWKGLKGTIKIYGAPIALEAVKGSIPLWILEAGLSAQPAGDLDYKIAPLATCFVTKEIVQPGESVKVIYSTYNSATTSIRINPPGKEKQVFKDFGILQLNPTSNTDVIVNAENYLGSVSVTCMIKVSEELPAEIIGKADDQFFYGKDENNNDSPWGYSVKFMVDDGENHDFIDGYTKAIRVLPDISHSTTLAVNNIDTIKNPNITLIPGEAKIVQHMGGVFRSYHTAMNVGLIYSSKYILGTDYIGDLGLSGVHLTRLNLFPSADKQPIISKLLRLLDTTLIAPNGQAISLLNPKPCEEDNVFGPLPQGSQYYLLRNGYIDVLVSDKLSILSPENTPVSVSHPEWLGCLEHQFVHPLPIRPNGDFTNSYSLKIDNKDIFWINSFPMQ